MAFDYLLSYILASTPACSPITVTAFALTVTVMWLSITSYYFASRTDTTPLLRYKKSTLARYILKKCPRLSEHHAVSGLWNSGHVQTLFSRVTFFRDKECFRRYYLQMKDKGCVALDVYADGTALKSCPTMLVIPTILGEATSVLGLCREAVRRGFRPVVFNRRGQSKSYLTTPYFQVIGDHSDLRQTIHYLKAKYPSSPLVAVSLGLGSGLLLSYLGEYGSSSRILACSFISPAFDYKSIYRNGMPQPYKWIQLQGLKSILLQHSNCFDDDILQKVLDTDDLLEFDWIVTGKADKEALDEYWENVNPLRDIDDISCPVLFVSAANDPICDAGTIPHDLVMSMPNFFSCLSEGGGHCGFVFSQANRDTAGEMRAKTGEPRAKTGESRAKTGEGSWAEGLSVDYLCTVLRFLKLEERTRNGDLRVKTL